MSAEHVQSVLVDTIAGLFRDPSNAAEYAQDPQGYLGVRIGAEYDFGGTDMRVAVDDATAQAELPPEVADAMVGAVYQPAPTIRVPVPRADYGDDEFGTKSADDAFGKVGDVDIGVAYSDDLRQNDRPENRPQVRQEDRDPMDIDRPLPVENPDPNYPKEPDHVEADDIGDGYVLLDDGGYHMEPENFTPETYNPDHYTPEVEVNMDCVEYSISNCVTTMYPDHPEIADQLCHTRTYEDPYPRTDPTHEFPDQVFTQDPDYRTVESYGDDTGYDVRGYDEHGYDRDGYNEHGMDREGHERPHDMHDETRDFGGDGQEDGPEMRDNNYGHDGYNEHGYNEHGYNRDGYNEDGYNEHGYDRDGYNEHGMDREGHERPHDMHDETRDFGGDGQEDGPEMRDNNYGHDGYNEHGYNEHGYNRDGYNEDGYNEDGYNQNGMDREGHERPDDNHDQHNDDPHDMDREQEYPEQREQDNPEQRENEYPEQREPGHQEQQQNGDEYGNGHAEPEMRHESEQNNDYGNGQAEPEMRHEPEPEMRHEPEHVEPEPMAEVTYQEPEYVEPEPAPETEYHAPEPEPEMAPEPEPMDDMMGE